ncbi:hypothetical protein ZWY2020_023148 [Hordeum vulgare]|nr:hypothetical protein ZWY2020_023148 [Hordeum vulgare]
MATPIVSAATGVMNPVIGKLTKLMGDEYKKLKGVRKEVAFLRDELSAMNAALEKLEFMEKLEPDTKNWRDRVREMSYDMENCIDDFMQDIGGADANASAGFMKRMSRRLKTLRVRHRIAGQIEDLKALAVEANERRIRYKIDDCNTSRGSVDIDPRISVIYEDVAELVGTDGPKKEVLSLLTGTEKKLKAVSIVGFGGLGKTTLANQVYDDLEGQFDCKAFIPVSQKPDMPRLLNSLRLKLGINESSGICEVQDIIGQLRKHLANKRYFIIVDDLWNQEAWEIIRCAFPENGRGSRVIVTTRVEGVAISACSYHHENIYRMKPLGSEDSRRIRIMESLRTLHGFRLRKSSLEALEGLGKLTNLRSLELHNFDVECNLLEKVRSDAFASSICKLRNLKNLRIIGDHDDKCDSLGSVSDPPALIEEIHLGSWKMLGVPNWIGDLHCLRRLELYVREMTNDAIIILGGLPSLVRLILTVVTCPKEEAVTVSKGLFPVLERLTFFFKEDVTAYLGFQAGAMPKLRELNLELLTLSWGGAAPVGIEHLLALQQISSIVWCKTKESREQVELEVRSAYSNAVQLHPKPPSVDIKCYHLF